MARTTTAFPGERNAQSPGWVAPNGRFFPCSAFEHDTVAEELAVKFYPHEARRKSGTHIFEEKHWVRLLDDGAFHAGPDLRTAPRITQAQRDRLFDLAMTNLDSDFSCKVLRWLEGAEELDLSGPNHHSLPMI